MEGVLYPLGQEPRCGWGTGNVIVHVLRKLQFPQRLRPLHSHQQSRGLPPPRIPPASGGDGPMAAVLTGEAVPPCGSGLPPAPAGPLEQGRLEALGHLSLERVSLPGDLSDQQR